MPKSLAPLNMFCLSRTKPKKSSHQPSPRSNEIKENNNNHNLDNQHATSVPKYRYVIKEFVAKAQDELTVLPGEVVFWHDHDGDWSYVSLCLSDRKDLVVKEGFVPNDILTTEPERNRPWKKKLPRSSTSPMEHHPHHLHQHTQHARTQPSVHEEARFHQFQHQHVCEHQPGSFGGPLSLQGSSGKQSFMKYPDLRNLDPPAYSNLRVPNANYEHGPDVRPFIRKNYGMYIVMNNFIAREENDLNVKPGETVHVLNRDDVDWFWVRREDLEEGFVPSTFICDQEQVKSILTKGDTTVTMKSSNHNDYHTYINHNPDRESLATDLQSTAFQHSFDINKMI